MTQIGKTSNYFALSFTFKDVLGCLTVAALEVVRSFGSLSALRTVELLVVAGSIGLSDAHATVVEPSVTSVTSYPGIGPLLIATRAIIFLFNIAVDH